MPQIDCFFWTWRRRKPVTLQVDCFERGNITTTAGKRVAKPPLPQIDCFLGHGIRHQRPTPQVDCFVCACVFSDVIYLCWPVFLFVVVVLLCFDDVVVIVVAAIAFSIDEI